MGEHARLQDILTHLDQGLEDALARLMRFLEIPSISTDPAHAGDVRTAAEWLCAELVGLGFDASIRDTPGHPMITARSPRGDARSLLFYGHYDVQPPDPLELWHTPPFEPTVRDGRIYARGSTDDKGQAFAHVKGAELLLQEGELPVNVKFLLEGALLYKQNFNSPWSSHPLIWDTQ